MKKTTTARRTGPQTWSRQRRHNSQHQRPHRGNRKERPANPQSRLHSRARARQTASAAGTHALPCPASASRGHRNPPTCTVPHSQPQKAAPHTKRSFVQPRKEKIGPPSKHARTQASKQASATPRPGPPSATGPAKRPPCQCHGNEALNASSGLSASTMRDGVRWRVWATTIRRPCRSGGWAPCSSGAGGGGAFS